MKKKLALLLLLQTIPFTILASERHKFFIDTHDRSKGSFPKQKISAQDFINKFLDFDTAALNSYMGAHVAHVNIDEGKAYCFTRAKDIETVRKVHEQVNLPFDSIIEVKTVSSSDLR